MNDKISLPEPIANYARAINSADLVAFKSSFATDAIVKDIGREIRGLNAIMEWARHEIFAVNVTLEILGVAKHTGQIIITAKIDGTFDRTGLPDPLVMTHSFTIAGDKIVELNCRLADVAGSA